MMAKMEKHSSSSFDAEKVQGSEASTIAAARSTISSVGTEPSAKGELRNSAKLALLAEKVETINNISMVDPVWRNPSWKHFFFNSHISPELIHPRQHLCVRKNQKDLTPQEQKHFKCAYSALISSGFLGPFVAIHGDMSHRMHGFSGPAGQQRFLPWHRIYLLELEQKLMAYHPDLCIPYWDWVNDREIPGWLEDFLPQIMVNGNLVTVVRDPGSPSSLPSQSTVNSILSQSTFNNFTSSLEGIHGSVHVWVGGTMALVPTAPADPIFWMHHANVDRLWHLWQQTHPGQNPSLSGSDAVMDPWMSFTEPDTRSVTALGFTYV